ncbi:MAG: DUF2304 domain-containing protein [Chloroflexi bacterium]|nr:DUF2304 domain-containing protein [Chloroflexota bacterium]
MVFRTRIFVILLALGVLIAIINLVRAKKIKEEFALLWLLTAVALVVIPLSIDVLDAIAFAIGVDYPPGLLFLVAFVGVLFILFQFSTSISKFSDQIKNIAQDLALLNKRVEELEAKRSRAGEAPDQEPKQGAS